jgi:hypothetical protein
MAEATGVLLENPQLQEVDSPPSKENESGWQLSPLRATASAAAENDRPLVRCVAKMPMPMMPYLRKSASS